MFFSCFLYLKKTYKNILQEPYIEYLEKMLNYDYMKNIDIHCVIDCIINLILTIISVPILKFDPDLVICHSVLLDDDINLFAKLKK